jgi:hypothetical protein
MTRCFVAAAILLSLVCGSALAADYRVETVKDAAPPEGVSAEIAAQLAPTAYKVMTGNRTVCEIWLAKQWDVSADFAPSATVLYPLKPGTLAGAIRLARKGHDFRDQEIPAGAYTLRYANQPVDGNHVGTFDTRDFLLMVPASADTSPDPIAEMDLFTASAGSAESTHPAIMPLVKAAEGDELPAMRHLEENDWWTLKFAGNDKSGGKVVLELIVAGVAAE